MDLSRRKFFERVGRTTAALAIPGVALSFINGCSNTPTGTSGLERLPTIHGSFQNGVVTIPIDSSSPLSSVGSVALVTFSSGSVLVDHPTADTYKALSSICPHASCLVSEYDSDHNEFYCPCHGSKFDLNGKVTHGPAGRSLNQYQTQLEGNQLSIFLS